MQKFKYRAMGSGGKIAEGEIEAADYKDACRKLRAAALSPISVGRADGGAREPAKPTKGARLPEIWEAKGPPSRFSKSSCNLAEAAECRLATR